MFLGIGRVAFTFIRFFDDSLLVLLRQKLRFSLDFRLLLFLERVATQERVVVKVLLLGLTPL